MDGILPLMLTLRIIWWTLTAPLAMRRGPVECFLAFSPRVRAVAATSDPAALTMAADRVLLFRAFGKLVFRTRCLKRALVHFRLLRFYGHRPVARIGFEKSNTGLVGHSWLTVGDYRVPDANFSEPGAFKEFFEIDDEIRRIQHA